MPILHIRAVPSELMARLKSSASDAEQLVDQYAVMLLDAALTAREQRRAGGRARAQQRTSEDQRATARARWPQPSRE